MLTLATAAGVLFLTVMMSGTEPEPVLARQQARLTDQSRFFELDVDRQIPPGYPVTLRVRHLGKHEARIKGGCTPVLIATPDGRVLDTDTKWRARKLYPKTLTLPPGELVHRCTWDQRVAYRGPEGMLRRPVPVGKYGFVLDGHVEIDRSSKKAQQELAREGLPVRWFEITRGAPAQRGAPITLALGDVAHVGEDTYIQNHLLVRATAPGGKHIEAATVRVFHGSKVEEVSLERGGREAARANGLQVQLDSVDPRGTHATFTLR